jgi:glycosyltransferase involved in cell wall biosynthesis
MARTIASVRAQQYPYIEYIVIDGASSDGTLDLIAANSDLIKKYVSEPDEGLYFAMNKGMGLASGRFLLFLNSGDCFASSSSLCKIMEGSRHDDHDVLLFGNVVLSYQKRFWHMPPREGGRAVVPPGYMPHHQSVLYPRSFYSENRYDVRFRVMADVDFTCRASRVLKREYRDVDLVSAELGGFTFTRHSSFSGVVSLCRERFYLYKKHSVRFSVVGAIGLMGMTVAKYGCLALGGVGFATWLMELKTKRRLLRNLGHSKSFQR